jgi:U4/U6.U5 tri-snRNP-associated protein 1
MAADESLSLAETNKLRVSMGLAPLADEAAGEEPDSDDPDAVAERNYSEIRDKERRAREEKEAKERLAKARNQRELRAKLQGKGLGDADPAAEGATAADWVKQSRKKAKERQAELEKLRAREKELEDRDREAVYGEDELEGLRVAHGAEDIEEGQDLILTLADKKVLDDDGGSSCLSLSLALSLFLFMPLEPHPDVLCLSRRR